MSSDLVDSSAERIPQPAAAAPRPSRRDTLSPGEFGAAASFLLHGSDTDSASSPAGAQPADARAPHTPKHSPHHHHKVCAALATPACPSTAPPQPHLLCLLARTPQTPAKSCLSANPTRDRRSVQWGSPRGASFRVTSPSTSITPMAKSFMSERYSSIRSDGSGAAGDVEEQESPDTMLNSSILREWDAAPLEQVPEEASSPDSASSNGSGSTASASDLLPDGSSISQMSPDSAAARSAERQRRRQSTASFMSLCSPSPGASSAGGASSSRASRASDVSSRASRASDVSRNLGDSFAAAVEVDAQERAVQGLPARRATLISQALAADMMSPSSQASSVALSVSPSAHGRSSLAPLGTLSGLLAEEATTLSVSAIDEEVTMKGTPTHRLSRTALHRLRERASLGGSARDSLLASMTMEGTAPEPPSNLESLGSLLRGIESDMSPCSDGSADTQADGSGAPSPAESPEATATPPASSGQKRRRASPAGSSARSSQPMDESVDLSPNTRIVQAQEEELLASFGVTPSKRASTPAAARASAPATASPASELASTPPRSTDTARKLQALGQSIRLERVKSASRTDAARSAVALLQASPQGHVELPEPVQPRRLNSAFAAAAAMTQAAADPGAAATAGQSTAAAPRVAASTGFAPPVASYELLLDAARMAWTWDAMMSSEGADTTPEHAKLTQALRASLEPLWEEPFARVAAEIERAIAEQHGEALSEPVLQAVRDVDAHFLGQLRWAVGALHDASSGMRARQRELAAGLMRNRRDLVKEATAAATNGTLAAQTAGHASDAKASALRKLLGWRQKLSSQVLTALHRKSSQLKQSAAGLRESTAAAAAKLGKMREEYEAAEKAASELSEFGAALAALGAQDRRRAAASEGALAAKAQQQQADASADELALQVAQLESDVGALRQSVAQANAEKSRLSSATVQSAAAEVSAAAARYAQVQAESGWRLGGAERGNVQLLLDPALGDQVSASAASRLERLVGSVCVQVVVPGLRSAGLSAPVRAVSATLAAGVSVAGAPPALLNAALWCKAVVAHSLADVVQSTPSTVAGLPHTLRRIRAAATSALLLASDALELALRYEVSWKPGKPDGRPAHFIVRRWSSARGCLLELVAQCTSAAKYPASGVTWQLQERGIPSKAAREVSPLAPLKCQPGPGLLQALGAALQEYA